MKRREAIFSIAGLVFTLANDTIGKPTFNAFQEINKVDVLAPYYTWYDDNWFYPDLIPHTYPLRAPYHSSDPKVAAKQNREKNHYGVTVDLVSWWGPGTKSYHWFKQGYMQASNFNTRKFCFLYEIKGRLKEKSITINGKEKSYFDFNDPYNKQKFLKDIEFLEKNYFKKYTNYYKVKGRPLLYVWMGNLKNFDKVSQRVREKVYLVGKESIFFPPESTDGMENTKRIRNFNLYDAITQYGISPVYIAKKYGSLTEECIDEYTQAVQRWDSILSIYAPHLELILPLQFAYHDNRGDIDPIDGKRRFFSSTFDQAETFARTARLLIKIIPRIKRINLVSYNEHWEGHGAEPSIQYSDMWLSLIKKYFKDWEPHFIPPYLNINFPPQARNKKALL